MPGLGIFKVPPFIGKSIDPNAAAFIAAAGITNGIQVNAINNFVLALKAINNVDANFVNFTVPANSTLAACYPMVGGTDTAHKFNLINPVDTDAGFRLHYGGGYVNNANGFQANGTTGYGDTHLIPDPVLNSASHGMEFYCDNWTARPAGADTEVGCWQQFGIGIAFDTGQFIVYDKGIQNGLFWAFHFTVGLHLFNRSANGVGFTKLYRDNKLIWTNAADPAGNLPNVNSVHLGHLNNLAFWSDRLLSYVGIRRLSISDAARTLYYNAITQLQIDLGRSARKNVIFEGHSLMQGFSATTDYYRPPSKVALTCSSVYANRIIGFNSTVLGSNIAAMTARYAASVLANKKGSYFTNILPIWIGTNDIGLVGNPVVVWANLLAYANQALADGFIPILLTCIVATPAFLDNPNRLIFNALMRANAPAGSYVIDLDLHPELMDFTDLLYFNADQIHLINAGYDIVSADLVALINTL